MGYKASRRTGARSYKERAYDVRKKKGKKTEWLDMKDAQEATQHIQGISEKTPGHYVYPGSLVFGAMTIKTSKTLPKFTDSQSLENFQQFAHKDGKKSPHPKYEQHKKRITRKEEQDAYSGDR